MKIQQLLSTVCSSKLALAITVALTAWMTPAYGAVIADSITEFSSTQGQDNWFYGFFNEGATPGSTPFSTGAFTQFDDFNAISTRWEADPTQVGNSTFNAQFLSINQQGGHPTGIGPSGQNTIIWAVRRYVSEVSGPVDIAFDLRKNNTSEPRGGGITGRIFVDGVEVFTQFIQNNDGSGVQDVFTRNVDVGTVIDFVIDPTGVSPGPPITNDSDFSARADGSIFSSIIETASPNPSPVPEPSTVLLCGLGFVGVIHRFRKQVSIQR